MKRLLLFCLFVLSSFSAFSQCLVANAVATPVSCAGGSDGEITVNVTQGVGPYTYELIFFRPSIGPVIMGSVNSANTSLTFKSGNGTLDELFDGIGIRANSQLTPVGNEYRVRIFSSGNSGDPFCDVIDVTGIIVTQPPLTTVSVADVQTDCDPLFGPAHATGSITLDIAGGTPPFDVTWSAGPTPVPAGSVNAGSHFFSDLDGGAYTVNVVDAGGCLVSTNIDVPVRTAPDAGPDQTICDAAAVLSASAPGLGEIGTWSGAGVTFSPNPQTPNATVSDLSPGPNVLRWTITDLNAQCPAVYDEVTIIYSPKMSLSATVTPVSCKGADTGLIDLSVTGGLAPFTFLWSNGATTEDLTDLPAGTYSVTVTDAAGCSEVLEDIIVGEPLEAVGAALAKTDVTCFGASTGSIQVTGTGGTAPYDFSIDNGATFAALGEAVHTFDNLPAGTYDIFVRDLNGCTFSTPVTVDEPASAVSGTATVVDAECFGSATGSVTIKGSGGVPPYDFSIDGGTTFDGVGLPEFEFENLSAGNYSIIVRDANGCETSIPATVGQPGAGVDATITIVDVLCYGASTGSITVEGKGGVAPYEFSLDGGDTFEAQGAVHTFDNLAAGAYRIVVRDANHCLSVEEVIDIVQPVDLAQATVVSSVDVTCFGGTDGEFRISGSGGMGPYDFSIDGGATFDALAVLDHTFTGLAAGTYDVVIRDANGCLSPSVEVALAAPDKVEGEITADDVACHGGSDGAVAITGTGGTGPYDFSNDGGVTFTITNVLAHTFDGLAAGTHSFAVRDANGCLSDLIEVTLSEPADPVDGLVSQIDIMCFGEATGSIQVTGAGGVAPYDFSVDGGVSFVENELDHNFDGLPAGTYDLVIRDANGCTSTVQITLNQPSQLTAAVDPVHVLCRGASTGSVEVTGSGGAAPYDFSIDGGNTFEPVGDISHTFVGLASGSYTVVIRDANNCVSDNVLINIDEPAAPVSASTIVTNVACAGGSDGQISVTGEGGVGPYDFSIDGGTTYPETGMASFDFMGLLPGVYNLRVRDANNCESDVITVTVLAPAPVTATISAVGDVVVCETDSRPDIVFNFTGNAPFEFTYTDGTTPVSVSNHPVNTYTIANAAAGDYSITALVDANGCVAIDLGGSIEVIIEEAAHADAGADQMICGGDAIQLVDGLFSGSATSAAWSIVSQPVNGDGVLSDDGYTATPELVTFTATEAGEYRLRLTTNDPAGQCPAGISEMIINVAETAVAVAGDDQTICAGATVDLKGTFSGATGIVWSSSGTGAFTDDTLPETVYTPSADDIANGSVTLTLTTVGPCAVAQDHIQVTIDPAPTVNAGMDATICSDATYVLQGSFGGSATGLIWSTSGDGKFNDETDEYTVYTPGPLDADAGFVFITATAAGSCSGAPSTMKLTLNPAATVDVGPGLSACDGNPVVLNAVLGGSATSVTWVADADADGFFDDPTLANATYTPGAKDMERGFVELTATTDNPPGPCDRAQATLIITTRATVTTAPLTLCANAAPVDLTAYVVTDPPAGTLTFTGAGVSGTMFDPSGLVGPVHVQVEYNFAGCPASETLPITVISQSDGVCSGGGNCESVVIVPKTSPATCTNSDGGMIMSIRPFTPAVNTTGVKISIDGTSITNLPISRTIFNDSVFTDLPVGHYTYSIEYGDPSCIKTGFFSIDQSGTVGIPTASDAISPACFGSSTGSVVIDVPGETGNVLEWSLDGGLTDPFKPFTAGTRISGIPAGDAPTYERVISVRRNASDVCFSSITFVLEEIVTPIAASFSAVEATCNGDDGAIRNINVTGGSGAGYAWSIDGGFTWLTEGDFDGLPGGTYNLIVRDDVGCEGAYSVTVTTPEFINAQFIRDDENCQGGTLTKGWIAVRVSQPGAYKVALSTSQTTPPDEEEYADYNATLDPEYRFMNLERGQYYVYIKSSEGVCATRSAVQEIAGFQEMNFSLVPHCNGNEPSIELEGIAAQTNTNLEIRVWNRVGAQVSTIVVPPPSNGRILLEYEHPDYEFLRTPDDYTLQVLQTQQIGDTRFCEIRSAVHPFRVPQELSAGILNESSSYPDIPTGSFAVGAFTGGAFPYDVRIELDSAASYMMPFFETEFEPVGANENIHPEKKYNRIPPGVYSVIVRDSIGCEQHLTARVPLDEGLFIPTVFTPNGDGYNDVFYIRNLPTESANNELIITNRWGKQVYASDNYQNNWNGDNVADGVYFYRLKVAGGEVRTGWVEIMRGQEP